jgi:hypothetical protein
LKFFVATLVDGDARLTHIASRENFAVEPGTRAATLPFIPHSQKDARPGRRGARSQGEAGMPRTDKSVAILTGMIVAALYVILLVGFSRESYMRRDAMAARADGANERTAIDDAARRMCRVERSICSLPLAAIERQSCVVTIGVARRLASHRIEPLTLEDFDREPRAAR